MDPDMKEWFQAVAWLATAVGVVIAAIKLWSEVRENRLQRSSELRWRQAEAGKSLNDEMQTDNRSWPAMQMLDSDSRTFTLPGGGRVTVSREDIVRALSHSGAVSSEEKEKDDFIRECFDTLFYFFATLDHYITSTLICEEDVAYPLEYYVPLLAELKPQVCGYLDRYNLWRAKKFLNRYPAWGSVANAPNGTIQ